MAAGGCQPRDRPRSAIRSRVWIMGEQHHARISATAMAPELYRGLNGVHRAAEAAARDAGLDHKLVELIKIRASQINNCAYCIDLHTRQAREAGEQERRIYALNAWRETSFFDDRERAALALTEAITQLTDGFVPDEVYQQAE